MFCGWGGGGLKYEYIMNWECGGVPSTCSQFNQFGGGGVLSVLGRFQPVCVWGGGGGEVCIYPINLHPPWLQP